MHDQGWVERVGRAIDFLEDHFREPVEIAEVARRAGFSRWHFLRIFQAAVGYGPGEYLRCRRLARAAGELLSTDRRLIDIALDHGYESQEAFTRAFQRQYDVTPASFRRKGIPDSRFRPFDPRLETRVSMTVPGSPIERWHEPFRLVGMGVSARKRAGEHLSAIPALWDRWLGERLWHHIPGSMENGTTYGVCRERAGGSDIDYLIGLRVEVGAPTPNGLRAMSLEGSRYAVFRAEGELPGSIQGLAVSVYFNWLPQWGERNPSRPDFEVYDRRLLAANPPVTELWVPLVD
jgi:AraC family transcriptional regulator